MPVCQKKNVCDRATYSHLVEAALVAATHGPCAGKNKNASKTGVAPLGPLPAHHENDVGDGLRVPPCKYREKGAL